MTDSLDELRDRLRQLTLPGARGRLVARGLARGMIWRDGVLPEGAPHFSASLTSDLLDQGYGLLGLALRARELNDRSAESRRGLLVAAEAIESAVRKGSPLNPDRGFHLVIASAAFHLAQYAARSFSLLSDAPDRLNLSTAERCLVALMRGNRQQLRAIVADWLNKTENSDSRVASRLADAADLFTIADAERVAITAAVLRALAVFDAGLGAGQEELIDAARKRLADAARISRDVAHVPLWWIAELALNIAEGLWEDSMHLVLPYPDDLTGADQSEREAWSSLRSRYLTLLAGRSASELQLWPSQIVAARRAADPTDDLVVALPTSSGKTRIAELCILRCLAQNRRVVYVTPLRALSAQVERTLAKTFVPLGYSVSSLYGASGVAAVDIGNLETAQIVVATPEKLDFAIRQQASTIDDVGLVVLDEGHMIGPGARELRYEVLVQRLLRREDAPHRRLVCLSAVFAEGDAFRDFTRWLRSDAEGEPIVSDWRPTRQRVGIVRWHAPSGRLTLLVDEEQPYVPAFFRAEAPRAPRRNAFPQNDGELVLATAKAFLADGQRVLVYCPQRGSVETLGKLVLQLHRQGHLPDYLGSEVNVDRALAAGEEWLGSDHIAVQCLRLGVALHHGLLPRAFLSEIETLLTDRKLRLAIASPTLAQGIDLSCGVLIFRSIHRGGAVIPAGEYANVVGRAGRAFVDLDGIAVYPVFQPNPQGRYRVQEFANLRRAALSREMESGILLLIRRLVALLSTYVGGTTDELINYVANATGPWTVEGMLGGRPRPTVDEGQDADEELATVLGELDTAILGTVEDANVPPELVAEALDAALQSSYWSRRLARLTPDDAALQRAVLSGRARSIWTRTTASQRQGFYACGIGFDAGVALDARLRELVARLREAEAALDEGRVDLAASAAAELASIVFEIAPFKPEVMPSGWRALLGGWLSGSELPPLLTNPLEDVGFIQHGIVYHLVWAIEAVRLQGIAAGLGEAEGITGSLALCLTYGTPSLAAALLAQSGLYSRRMVMTLLAAFPATFVDTAGLSDWLEPILSGNVTQLWSEPGARSMWDEFARRWTDREGGRWRDYEQEVAVSWLGNRPPDGSRVRLLRESRGGRTFVYDLDLTLLGEASQLGEQEVVADTISVVLDGGTRLSIRHFGLGA